VRSILWAPRRVPSSSLISFIGQDALCRRTTVPCYFLLGEIAMLVNTGPGNAGVCTYAGFDKVKPFLLVCFPRLCGRHPFVGTHYSITATLPSRPKSDCPPRQQELLLYNQFRCVGIAQFVHVYQSGQPCALLPVEHVPSFRHLGSPRAWHFSTTDCAPPQEVQVATLAVDLDQSQRRRPVLN